MTVEASPLPAAGALSRLVRRRLTRAPDTRLYSEASGRNRVPNSRPGSPSGSDAHPGRSRARLSRLLPALALLLGALSPLAAGPAAAQTELWSGALTVKDIAGISLGCATGTARPCRRHLSEPRSFTHAGTSYAIQAIRIFNLAGRPGAANALLFGLDKTWPTVATGKALRLHVDDATFRYEDVRLSSSDQAIDHIASWRTPTLRWSLDQQVALRLVLTDASGGDATRSKRYPLVASFLEVPERPSGAAGMKPFDLMLRLTASLRRSANKPVASSFQVTNGTVIEVARVRSLEWRVRVRPASMDDVTVTLRGNRACNTPGAVCTRDGRQLSNTVIATVSDAPPAIVIRRASAREAAGAVVFNVRLRSAAAGVVTVDYATEDGRRVPVEDWPGRAVAGLDYTATSGTLTFAVGETLKRVRVPIIDDAIDEGEEYFVLRLSNPQGMKLPPNYEETMGVIRNTDPLQAMWLSRFGRMVASDAVEAVTARLETPRAAGSHLTLAGQRLDLTKADDGRALADAVAGFARAFGAEEARAPGDDPFARHGRGHAWNDPTTTPGRAMTGRELLLGTSFRAVFGGGAGSQLTSWGQGASVSRFSAAVPGLALSGDAATGALGMDFERGPLLTGFAMTHSVGDGAADDGEWRYAMGSTVTTMLPYARYALSERVSTWAMAGTGSGRLTLDLDGGVSQHYDTDLAMTLAAMGVRGELLSPAEPGGFVLALKADAFWIRTESDRVTTSFGNLMGARGESSRMRAVLDGSRTFALAGGRALSPSLELGLRQDGGDAETGTGLELGAGLGYADASRGLDMGLRVHGLAAHAEDRYSEWGVSGQLRLVPGAAGRGLSASLTPSLGVDPGVSERLWAVPASSGLAANGDAVPSSRVDTEVGFGLPVFGGAFTGTPNVGFGLSDTARDLRIGWRLTSALPGDSPFELNLDAVRREAADERGAEHGVMLRSAIRW